MKNAIKAAKASKPASAALMYILRSSKIAVVKRRITVPASAITFRPKIVNAKVIAARMPARHIPSSPCPNGVKPSSEGKAIRSFLLAPPFAGRPVPDCRDTGPLKLKDFLPLASDLDAHVFDFASEIVEVWHVSLCEIVID